MGNPMGICFRLLDDWVATRFGIWAPRSAVFPWPLDRPIALTALSNPGHPMYTYLVDCQGLPLAMANPMESDGYRMLPLFQFQLQPYPRVPAAPFLLSQALTKHPQHARFGAGLRRNSNPQTPQTALNCFPRVLTPKGPNDFRL